MQLKDLFLKPIDRPIEGVIKADDLQHLHTEIDEYVITDEVARHLETFLGAYHNYSGANGVWISGFFGSGKSHLLKMLAYLLENRTLNGLNIAQSFRQKVVGNAFLEAEINRISQTSSESILFNIDQKADTASKDQADAVLGVFVRVFNEHCGYFGKQPHLAQFERDLDRQGLLEAFKDSFMQLKGEGWERGRGMANMRKDVIAKAYAEVTGTPPDLQLLDSYRQDYTMSIDDFARMVNEYVQARGNRFRLNFFVDEVGQYIADNTKLMTNLQSIAESLATHCRGQAWIVVTAQQEMGKVVKEFQDSQKNDFSKIQARFGTKMNLSSKNVEEVIQRRLLTKTPPATQALQSIYTREKDNFGTWFTFTENTQTQRNIRDADHFVQSYPFLPYQFDLFQQAMESLSLHDNFEGKHSSVGERSMLAVFQGVARSLSKEELPALATFDRMFDGLRSTLKSSVLRSIHEAEKKIGEANPFAMRVLKVLFLIKYINGFKSTLENLMILLYGKINENIPELKKSVQRALHTLENESYIKRNPNHTFEYLTNDEQDVEQEIKSVSVNNEDLLTLLGQIVFDDILKDKSIPSDSGRETYPFNKRIDQVPISRGQTHELTIQLVSSFDARSVESIKLESSGKSSELWVVLSSSTEDVMSSLRLYQQTEQYIKLTKNNLTDTKQQIIARKRSQNEQFKRNLTANIALALSQAVFIINGSEVFSTPDKATNEPQARLIAGFRELIRQTYTNLSMIQHTDYRSKKLANVLMGDAPNDGLAPLTEAEREVLNSLTNLDRRAETVSVKRVMDIFKGKPYGWSDKAIWFQLAYLCQKGKVEVRQDSNLLGLKEVLDALEQTNAQPRLLLKPTQEFNPSQVRQLKEWYKDLFNEDLSRLEAKALAERTQSQLRTYLAELQQLHQLHPKYPFLKQLSANVTHLETILQNKDYGWYLTDFVDAEGDYLLENHTDLIAVIKAFMNGKQREIYDQATAYYHEQRANLAHADATLTRDIERALKDDAVFRGNALQKIKQQVEQLHTQIEAERTATLNAQRTRLEQMWDRLNRHSGYAHLRDTDQRAFEQTFTDCLNKLKAEQVIAVIKETVALFEEREFPSLLNKLERARPLDLVDAPTDTPSPITPPKPVMVSARELVASLSLAHPTLTNEAELDRYLSQLRQRFLTELQNGKHIHLED